MWDLCRRRSRVGIGDDWDTSASKATGGSGSAHGPHGPDWRRQFLHLACDENDLAKVAMARKLAVRLHWMWRKGWDY